LYAEGRAFRKENLSMQISFCRTKIFLIALILTTVFISYRVESTQNEGESAIKPIASGYSEVNGINLYREIYGKGDPVILLHGGLMTIPEMMPLIQSLGSERTVIAVELQGHGRTADTDRPLSIETLGNDVAALIADLGLKKPDVIGYSFGGAVALRTAIQHPDFVRRLIVLSTPYARSGWYPEVLEGMSQVNSKMAEQLMKVPVGIASQKWPEPERFPQFLDKMGAMMAEDYDWSAEIRKLKMPVMLMFADHDAISTRHIAEFYALLGGGLKDAGWQNTQFTNARLAIIPGYSHYNFSTAPELGLMIKKYLSDPLKKPNTDDAAGASKVSN
jgi:pimeloyl-ACP methyl ester carboxylesterase